MCLLESFTAKTPMTGTAAFLALVFLNTRPSILNACFRENWLTLEDPQVSLDFPKSLSVTLEV